MFTVAYVLFLSLGWMNVPFDLGVFLLLVFADILTIPLQAVGRWLYEKLRGKKK